MKTKRWISLLLTFVLCLGLLPGTTLAETNEGTENAELMYRYMSRADGQFYEDTSESLISVSDLDVSYGDSAIVRFYYGTDDSYTPATSVTAPEGSCITVTSATTTDGNSTTYWELVGTDLGTASLSVAVGDQTYTASVPVVLPDNGFYTSYTDLSKATYLPDGFTYDGTNNTFYLVWNNSHSYIPANSNVTIAYWDSSLSGLVSTELVETDVTFNNTSTKRNVIKFTIADTISDDFGFTVNFGLINQDGDSETNNWGIRITDNSPKLMYRYISRNNGQSYENTEQRLNPASELSINYGNSEAVRFYYGNSVGYVPATSVSVSEGSCLTVSSATTNDGNSTTYWELEGTDLGTASLSIAVGDQTYSVSVPVVLPDNGFYTSYTDLSKATYLPDGFTYDGTNNTFYLVWNNSHSYIPANSNVTIAYWDSSLSGLVSTELVETDVTFNNTSTKRNVIKFTIADTISDDFGFTVNFGLINRDGGTETNNWGIRITDNTPKLMYRYISRNNGQSFENTEQRLNPASELSINYGNSEAVRFYYGNSYGYVPATSVSVSEGSCLTVSSATTTDGNSTTYWELEGTDLGTASLSIAVGDQTYSVSVPVVLPGNGFYTSYTNLSKATYLPDGFTYDATSNTFYLVWNNSHSYIPANSNVTIAYWDSSLSGLVSTELVETDVTFYNTSTKRNAIKFTIADTISDDFGFTVNFGLINRDGDTETNNWGIRITDNTPKLMYRHINWNNGQSFENTEQRLNPASELSISYGNTEAVKFYYGNSDGYVPATFVSVSEGICITVTSGTTTDGNSTTYWELKGTDLGTATLSVSGGTGDNAFAVSPSFTVDLPLIGTYSDSTASKDKYCSVVEYTGEAIQLYVLPNSSAMTITSVTANEGAASDYTTISGNLVTISNELTANCNLSYQVFYTIGDSSRDVYVNVEFVGKQQSDEGSSGGINFTETLISETRLIENTDKLTYVQAQEIEAGPAEFQYDVNGDGTPETYYLCTMAPMYEDQSKFNMAYAGSSRQSFAEDAEWMFGYCIGIWTKVSDNYYELVNGTVKDTLLAAFGESWLVNVYHEPVNQDGTYLAASFPAVYSWTPADGWPCGRTFIHYADCYGDWDYVFSGVIGGETVTAYAHAGYRFSYEALEYTASTVAEANEILQYWVETKDSDDDSFMGNTTYTLNLNSGEYTGIICVPEGISVQINGSGTDERTVLTGGIIGDGCASVSSVDFIGCGWWATNWPDNDVFNGEPNYGLGTAMGGRYSDCSFKNYYHALHCGYTQSGAPILIFGGEQTLFENNFIALYLNSNRNGGGDLTMYQNTFRYNGCALWLENTGNDFPLNSYHLIKCKFYDNGWDMINLLGKCYFLPGQLFEREGAYGHGKFAGRRDALNDIPAQNRPEKASGIAADVSQDGSGVYTFPVAKNGEFSEFDYTNSNAVIDNANASSWLIPEENLSGKTITVIQDDTGEDAVVWSFD